MQVEVQNKPQKEYSKDIKIINPEVVFNLAEVQEIKNAIQEHLIYIGMDRGNNIRNLKIIGIGTSSYITIDSKDIIRTALINADERVILVHNHPSNKLEPSSKDKHLTDFTGKLMEVFNIELVDHLIVTENDFVSMKQLKSINRNYTNENLEFMNNAFLVEENSSLKQELEELKKNNMEEMNMMKKCYREKEIGIMKKYENVVIINPKLEEKEIKETIEKYKNMIQGFSGKEPKVEEIGEKKLAYEIKKHDTGYYAIFNFYSQPEDIAELERNYRIDDNIMKFIVVRMDEELEYNESEEEDEEEQF